MPNPIKYSTGSETLSLKKGNFYIGTGDVGKGPSDVTGFYQGPSPASGGYVIYLNKEGAPGGLSYHSAANDSQLISFTNNLASTSFTSATQCLNYFTTQTDKVCFNRDYEGIVTNGLVLNVDAGFTPSYSRSGTTWYDVSSIGNNGTLTNGPTFNSDNGGSIVFDGVNDFVDCGNNNSLKITGPITINAIFKVNSFTNDYQAIVSMGDDSYRFQRHAATNKLAFGTRNIGLTDLITTTNISENTWYITSAVYNGSTMQIYINGVLDITGNASGSLPASSYNLRVGGNAQFPARAWNGYISNTQIYNRALSSTEVLQNYNAMKGRYGL
jgi:hypothetical protein